MCKAREIFGHTYGGNERFDCTYVYIYIHKTKKRDLHIQRNRPSPIYSRLPGWRSRGRWSGFLPRRGAVRFNGRPLGVWAAPAPAVYLLSAMWNGGAQFIIDKWSRARRHRWSQSDGRAQRICHSVFFLHTHAHSLHRTDHRIWCNATIPTKTAIPHAIYCRTQTWLCIYIYIVQ